MKTSWGNVASWYDGLLEKEAGTYQKEVILPNLIRVLAPQKGEHILDIACGQGFFSREIARAIQTQTVKGAPAPDIRITALDISPELVDLARRNPDSLNKKIIYAVSPANKLGICPDRSVDGAIIVLALQNIEDIAGVFSECARVLQANGRLVVVLNHPSFRIPKHSGWGWDSVIGAQYRRIDAYMSDMRQRIDMNPGAGAQVASKTTISQPKSSQLKKEFTVSFHRPLQVYVKALAKAGFAITRLEEWVSHKQSAAGPRAKEEDRVRKEIPMFMMLEVKKIR